MCTWRQPYRPALCTRIELFAAFTPPQMVTRDPDQPPTSRDKPGILSSRAPSNLTLNVGATRTEVFVGYLQSYDKRMGILEVSCVEGCVCKKV
jgi:hypothetical protein